MEAVKMFKNKLLDVLMLFLIPPLMASCGKNDTQNASHSEAENGSIVYSSTDSVPGIEMWVYDENDPWTHTVRAHESFRAHDTVTADAGIRRAVSIIMNEMPTADPEIQADMKEAAARLTALADSLKNGFPMTQADFDQPLAYSQMVLSRYHRMKSEAFYKTGDYVKAGEQMLYSTRNAEYAQLWMEHLLDPDSEADMTQLLDYARKLQNDPLSYSKSFDKEMATLDKLIAFTRDVMGLSA